MPQKQMQKHKRSISTVRPPNDMSAFHEIVRYFDKLEDGTRFALSRRPILYALVGAVGIVLVWKGVWEMAGTFPALDGPISFLLGIGILLVSGLLVSFFIGDSIILSGYRHEKKLVEKAEREVRSEKDVLDDIVVRLERIERQLAKGASDTTAPLY